MASHNNVTTELGPFVMPHLVSWWKQLRVEQAHLHHEIAKVRGKLRIIDKSIHQCKERAGPASEATERKIRQRKKLEKKELAALEWRIHGVEKGLKSLDSMIDEAIQPYARSSCHSLTSNFYEKMPRELRDMVYGYLLDSQIVGWLARQVRYQVEHQDCNNSNCSCLIVFELPHYLDQDFAPAAVSIEIMAMVSKIYSSRLASASSNLKTTRLEGFAELRALNIEFPASEFFRNLNFELDIENMYKKWKLDVGRVVNDLSNPEWVAHMRQLLLSIPARGDRELTFLLNCTRLMAVERQKFEHALDPVLKELTAKEFRRVQITWYPTKLTGPEMLSIRTQVRR